MVKVARRDRQHLYLKRPIQLLYPLETPRQQSDLQASDSLTVDDPDPKEDATVVRPKRAAARRAEELRRSWISELEKDDSEEEYGL